MGKLSCVVERVFKVVQAVMQRIFHKTKKRPAVPLEKSMERRDAFGQTPIQRKLS